MDAPFRLGTERSGERKLCRASSRRCIHGEMQNVRRALSGASALRTFFCDYGYNIALGDDVFINFHCVILDVVAVTIGERTQIGPGVQIYAADHPRHAAQRLSGFEFGRPITIGCNVAPSPIATPGRMIAAPPIHTRSAPAASFVVAG